MNILNSSSESPQLLVIIPDLTTGGGERVTRQLIEELCLQGYQIRLVANMSEEARSQLTLASCRNLDWNKPIKRFVIIASELYRCSKNTQVLAVLTGPIVAVGALNLLFGRVVVGYEHSDVEQLYLNIKGFKHWVRKVSINFALKSVRRVAVVSEYLRGRLPRVVDCNPDKVFLVRNPVQPFLKKLNCNALELKEGNLTAYIIGRNSPEKRHCEAIELLAKSTRVSRIILVARNAEVLREQLASQANEKLKIFNCLSEIRSFSTNKSFLLSYSAVESYSLVIAEWLASGLPVLTVDSMPMRSLWAQWYGCYFLPVHSRSCDLDAAIRDVFDGNKLDERRVFEPISIKTTVGDFERLLYR